MKKLVSISFVLISLSILINCSPKTAKTTAASSEKTERHDDGTPISKTIETTEIKADVAVVKDVPVTPPATTAPKGPGDLPESDQLAMYQGMAPLRVEVGQKIFTQNCGKCHKLPMPDSRTSDKWIHVMTKMGPKAKFTNEQYMMVAAYLVQNAKK